MGVLDKPYLSLTDLNSRDAQRMLDLGRENRARSNAQSNAAFTDSRTGQFFETWAGLTNWVQNTANATVVSAGRLYSAGSSGTAIIGRALGYIPGTTMRITTTIRVNGGGGGIGIGIGEGTAGAAPSASLNDTKGIYVPSGSNVPVQMNHGTTTALVNTTAVGTNDLCGVTIVIDPNYVTITLVAAAEGQEYRTRFATSSVTLNNLVIFNSDTVGVGASGKYFGPLAAVSAFSTATPRVNAGGSTEGLRRSTYWTSLNYSTAGAVETGGLRIALPKTYDSRVPSPFALMWHGHSSDETHWGDNTNGKLISNALNAAGIITIGFASNTTTPWGAQRELDAGTAAYQWARENLNLGPGLFYCNSMGSIDGLLSLAERRIPGIHGYIGTSPTFSLLANYDNAAQAFLSSINTAYGITNGATSASATIGATSITSTTSFPRELRSSSTTQTRVDRTTNSSQSPPPVPRVPGRTRSP